MRKLIGLKFYLLLFLTLSFVSCNNDDPEPITPPGSEGFFIVNEGSWGNGNTSLSFYNRETGIITNDLFYTANDQTPLGDQSQSMTIHDEFGYIVVQNSAKIEVINIDDYTSVATITDGIESPRYFVGYSNTKGFVSDWGVDGVSGTVKVIDLASYKVSNTIPTGQGSNNMLIVGNKLFVTNSGGWGRDNKVTVINADSEEVVKSIEVGDNPNSIQQDANGNIWVLSSGHIAYDQDWNLDPVNSTKGTLHKLTSSGDEILSLTYPELGSPTNLSASADGSTLYYLYNGGIYIIDQEATTLPASPLIEENYYGLAIDPIDNSIIGCEASDFASSGNIDIYSETGKLKSTHKVGIGPNSCTFK